MVSVIYFSDFGSRFCVPFFAVSFNLCGYKLKCPSFREISVNVKVSVEIQVNISKKSENPKIDD